MTRFIAFILLAAFTLAPTQAARWELANSEVLDIKSPDGHDYKIMVAWPDTPAPADGWPVLWLLDGEDNFAISVMTARRLTKASARSGVEPGLIVAVESGSLTRRVLDYTPLVAGYSIPSGAPAAAFTTGGADAFLNFLEKSVRPEVMRRWPIDKNRSALMGHSFGGLLVVHALTQDRGYSDYIAISPSLWFGDGIVQKRPLPLAAMPKPRLKMAIGEREGGPMEGLGSLEPFLQELAAKGIAADYKLLPGQSHGSTMMASMVEGIMFAFKKGEKR